jgi:sigma-B regulation protein RsbU (phosphoserine phosphatase)
MLDANLSSERASAHGRVLLIDDDPQICHVFRRVLEWRGHEVFEAHDGQAGLAAAVQQSPDIILLDLNLPVIGGLELLGKLAERLPETPVIIVSGSGTMSDAIAALKLGAWDYLIKPLPEVTSLAHTVESNLERSRLIRQNKAIRLELEHHHKQIQEDEEAGRKMQARLFPPQAWQLGEYEFEHWSIPSLELSGDFVDYFSLGERHAGFYCADISGHGVSSALVTVLVKSLMTKYREHFEERQDRLLIEPDRLLAQLNKDLLHEQLGKHLTIFYGVVDRVANTLRCASGGQYPPPLLFGEAGVRPLLQKGMAVGLFPFAVFEAETLPLPAAFRLVVFSDGALDALMLPAAEDRLAFLAQLATREQLLSFIQTTGASRHLPDDLTVLSVSREAKP